MSPVSRLSGCTETYTRRERSPEDPNTLTAKTVRCMLETDAPHPYHIAPDPFDDSAEVFWNGTAGALKPVGSGPDGITQAVSLAYNGTRRLPDTPAASDTLGAPSVTDTSPRPQQSRNADDRYASADVGEAVTPDDVTAEDLLQEVAVICDTLARQLAHLRVELARERRLRADAEHELERRRTGQVAA